MEPKRLSYDVSAETLNLDNGFENDLTDPKRIDEAARRLFDKDEALNKLISENLTEKQQSYLKLYYTRHLTISQIAERCGVDKSTVSRTIKRGRQRIAGELSRMALSRVFNENK